MELNFYNSDELLDEFVNYITKNYNQQDMLEVINTLDSDAYREMEHLLKSSSIRELLLIFLLIRNKDNNKIIIDIIHKSFKYNYIVTEN